MWWIFIYSAETKRKIQIILSIQRLGSSSYLSLQHKKAFFNIKCSPEHSCRAPSVKAKGIWLNQKTLLWIAKSMQKKEKSMRSQRTLIPVPARVTALSISQKDKSQKLFHLLEKCAEEISFTNTVIISKTVTLTQPLQKRFASQYCREEERECIVWSQRLLVLNYILPVFPHAIALLGNHHNQNWWEQL